MHRRWIFFVVLVSLTAQAALWNKPVQADQLMEISTRPGVTVRLALSVPETPKAVAVLFSGGHGHLLIDSQGDIKRAGNFLIAARQNFAKFGMVAAAMDAPSDQLATHGKMSDRFRQSSEHVTDIRAVVAALRQRFGVPVWLVGTSRGSTSVAHAAIEMNTAGAIRTDTADGIVLTSSIGVHHQRDGNLLDMPLGAIRLPALVLHHENDSCKVTPFTGARDIAAGLTASPRAGLIRITGGKRGNDVCGPVSHHGFRGQRGKVVKRIVKWILTR